MINASQPIDEINRGSTTVPSEKPLLFQSVMLMYWKTNGRNGLPWRQTRDPWKILLAEALLRKTTSRQAVPVYNEISCFMPDQIDKMEIGDLCKVLKPLGLYKVRAVHLKETATRIIESGTTALRDSAFLDSLPGVGSYIRNAVLCFAYGLSKPALDTNMIRVITRIFDYQTNKSRAREDKKLWEFAESLVPMEMCREYNWAVLDFAAAVCTARKPKCKECSAAVLCCFYQKYTALMDSQ